MDLQLRIDGYDDCPFLDDPQPDCYIADNTTGPMMRRVTEYCLGDFRLCDIYKRVLGE